MDGENAQVGTRHAESGDARRHPSGSVAHGRSTASTTTRTTVKTVGMAAGTSAGRPAAMEAELASVHPGPAAPVCEAAGRIARSEETIEVEVIRLLPGALAVVRTPAGTEEVGIALVDAHPGDAVLVHAGEAIAVL